MEGKKGCYRCVCAKAAFLRVGVEGTSYLLIQGQPDVKQNVA